MATAECYCPLCEHADTRTKIYQHLQTTHRKSALAEALLAEQAAGSQPAVGATESAAELDSEPSTLEASSPEPSP
jgi:hypothetical protein